MKWDKGNKLKLEELLTQKLTTETIAGIFGISAGALRQQMSRQRLRKPKKGEGQISRKRNVAMQEDIATRIRILLGEEVRHDRPSHYFSDAQLESWLSGIEGWNRFLEELFAEVPQQHQIDMLDMLLTHKRCCFVVGRQGGKDWTIARAVLWRCITTPNFKVILASGAQRQSDLLMEQILTLISRSLELFDSVEKSNREELRFKNNSAIYALPSSGIVRGYSEISLLVVNETRDVPDAAFDSLEPALARLDGTLALFSTPLGVSGRLWEAFNSPLYAKLQLPSEVNEYLSKEHLEMQKATMSSLSFETEYLANFMDIASQFFSLESIQNCVRDYDLVTVAEEGKVYNLGIDWGRHRNSSVLTVVSKDQSGFLQVENIKEFQGVEFSIQLSHIKRLNSVYHFSKIVSESAGLGIGPTESLEEAGFPVQKFKPTAESKLESYDHLKLKMENQELTLPATLPGGSTQHLVQLKTLQLKVTPSGNVTIHGADDDYCDSLMLAVWGFHQTHEFAWIDASDLTF